MMFDVLNGALTGMVRGPRRLEPALVFTAENSVDGAEDFTMERLFAHLKQAGSGDKALGALRKRLGQWDNEEADWEAGTERNTQERRALIYQKLDVPEAWIAFCDIHLKVHKLEPATVIATKHVPWYTPEVRQARAFYWPRYAAQLEKQGWGERSLLQLDDSTTSVVERLADPTAEGAYQSKGLVVGYVQSGKTANFTGVIAKAADAGYKLIIVMGGVLDVLRFQTQRRLDKELIGKELLAEEYSSDPDYADFVSHGAKPSSLGAFDLYRLTGSESDYQGLKYGREALKFEGRDPTKTFWNPDNLLTATTRIAVVKKHGAVLQKLTTDLRAIAKDKLGVPLDQVPVLIIDDESDQAGINVAKSSPSGAVTERSTTNKAIVGLLRLLPRAQYVGYTATPSANVLVDHTDAEDIFPKDFLISLPRPDGYMGVSDFYDLDKAPDGEVGPKERDYVRRVLGVDDKPANLQKAIDSYVLSGAIKLYRASLNDTLRYRHHTMLAHVSQLQAEQKTLAVAIRKMVATAGYDGGKGLDRLVKLFEDDFGPVHAMRGGDLPFPPDFETLVPFVGLCLTKIGEPAEAVKIVNTDHPKETPDFDRDDVWKILVGGAKLSRGYTVEGLTISYYRRRAGASDTLMQMGRWFGFRRGYQDLVRLFIGTDERNGGPRSTKRINLYDAFGAICRDEEGFREELKRYAEDPKITPVKIPPLVPHHMLRPTSPNKMRNAVLAFRNYGGELTESTYAPSKADALKLNDAALKAMIGGRKAEEITLSGVVDGSLRPQKAVTLTVTNAEMITFLKAYQWDDAGNTDVGNPMQLQIEFLQGHGKSDPKVDDWLILAPRINRPRGEYKVGGAALDVVYRSRQPDEARLNTYNDKRHRAYAEHIIGKTPMADADAALKALTASRRGVMLLYPITDIDRVKPVPPPYKVGFTLLFPKNDIPNKLGWEVRQANKPFDAVVLTTEDDDAPTPVAG